jgi:hypothetical protein
MGMDPIRAPRAFSSTSIETLGLEGYLNTLWVHKIAMMAVDPMPIRPQTRG